MRNWALTAPSPKCGECMKGNVGKELLSDDVAGIREGCVGCMRCVMRSI